MTVSSEIGQMSVARPSRRPRLSLRIVESLRADLTAGTILPGQKLPTETQLAEQFSVSRAVVREATAILAAEGLLRPQQGSGVYATRRLSRSAFASMTGTGVSLAKTLNVLEVRIAIEAECAALAAQRHNLADAAAMEDAFGESCEVTADMSGSDHIFHRSIASATGNPFFVDFLDALRETQLPIDLHEMVAAKEPHDIVAEHRRIVEAIITRDSDGARSAMRAHLVNCQERSRTHFRAWRDAAAIGAERKQ